MDASSASSWLCDLLLQETEDCELFRPCHLNLFNDDDDDEELLPYEIASVLNNDDLQRQQQQPFSFSWESNSSCSETLINSFTDEPILLSFDNSNSPHPNNTQFYGHVSALSPKQNEGVRVSVSPPRTRKRSSENQDNEGVRVSVSPPRTRKRSLENQDNEGVRVLVSPPRTRKRSSENPNFENQSPKGQGNDKCLDLARDHIMAERKRRENLSRSLIALAALIPGLKKMDKASVLGDAIKYVKELKERVKMLEEQNKNRGVECLVKVKKAQLSCDEHSDSRDDDNMDDDNGGETLPGVEARVSEKDVLLRIRCQKQKGLLLKILVEIQNLHLFVVNSSVLPLGDSLLYITIVAQMGSRYSLTTNDLVKYLRLATFKSTS